MTDQILIKIIFEPSPEEREPTLRDSIIFGLTTTTKISLHEKEEDDTAIIIDRPKSTLQETDTFGDVIVEPDMLLFTAFVDKTCSMIVVLQNKHGDIIVHQFPVDSFDEVCEYLEEKFNKGYDYYFITEHEALKRVWNE